MRQLRDVTDTMDLMYKPVAERGLLYRNLEGQTLDGRLIRFDGRDVVHFGSCSYLGLELHPELKAGAIDAVNRYGTQFSASRAAASCPLYGDLEHYLTQIFGMPVLVAPSTSLAHVGTLPVLVGPNDAVILDQQVHASVSMATNHLLIQGTHVEVVRHSRMDLLEERIKVLRQTHDKVWYMADGIYSMFGDVAPMQELTALLEAYPCLHLYMDDAHGLSWTGLHGRGHVLEQLPYHERMVTVSSMAKAFGVGGGIVAIPDPELRRKVRTVGTTFVFSGPLQPPVLGAAVASAKLHLTDALAPLQRELQAKIETWNALCQEHELPLVSYHNTPVRFIGAGRPQAASAVVERLIQEGVYPTLSIYPLVPMKRSGIRFAINLHQTTADLEHAVEMLARHLPRELENHGSSVQEVFEQFALERAVSMAPAPAAPSLQPAKAIEVTTTPGLVLEHHEDVDQLDAAEWDRLLGHHGTYSVEGLRFLQEAFSQNPERENNWRFHYYVVRDGGRPVLATFFTETWLKDDMLAPEEASREIERRRQAEPDFLVSKALMMGSMLSEGNHLYLDRRRDWRGALTMLLRAVDGLQAELGASSLVLRDLSAEDTELDAFLREQGLARASMPESLELSLDWRDHEGYMNKLSAKSRLHQRKKVMPFDQHYDVEILTRDSRKPDQQELDHYYELYKAVADRNLSFNCFPLPRRLLGVMLEHPRWEVLALRLKPEHGGEPGALPVAFMACYRGHDRRQFVPLFCGLDYRYVESHGAYRQLLRKTIMRAHTEGFRHIFYGFGATHEKTRYGCKPREQYMYVQANDMFNMEVLAQLMKVGAKA